MPAPISHDRLRDYFTAYGSHLAEYDAEASAQMWGTPGMILDDAFVGVLDSREEMAAGLSAGYPPYRRFGLDGLTPTLVDVEQVTERIVRVHVRWHFFASDEHLVDGDYQYTLRDDDDGLHAYVAIAIDEREKLAALAAERGIDLPS